MPRRRRLPTLPGRQPGAHDSRTLPLQPSVPPPSKVCTLMMQPCPVKRIPEQAAAVAVPEPTNFLQLSFLLSLRLLCQEIGAHHLLQLYLLEPPAAVTCLSPTCLFLPTTPVASFYLPSAILFYSETPTFTALQHGTDSSLPKVPPPTLHNRIRRKVYP